MEMNLSEHDFPGLRRAAANLGARSDLGLAELRELLCRDCDFFHEDHEDDLECSCFRMLKLLIVRGALTPEKLAEALEPGRHAAG